MNRDNVYTKVYETMDYDKFSFIEGNRPVSESHVNNIMKSMKKGELISPIIVNENKQITEGQHRFTSWKRLGKSVKYIIGKGYGIKETQTYNSNQKNWNLDTVIQSYADLGYKDYIKILEIKDKYKGLSKKGIATSICISLLCGMTRRDTNLTKTVKNGDFKVTSLQYATKILDAIEKIQFYCPEACQVRNFIFAFAQCYKVDGFNLQTFMTRVKSRGDFIERSPRLIPAYRMAIQETYNYNARKENRLYLTEL
jgi:hypothetical protein